MRHSTKTFDNKAATKIKWLNLIDKHLKLPLRATEGHYTLFHKLVQYCNNHSEAKCWLSQDTLAQTLHISVTTLKRRLNDLYEWGAVTRRRQFNDSNVYVVNWRTIEGGVAVNAAMEQYLAKYQRETGSRPSSEPLRVINMPVVDQIGFAGSRPAEVAGSRPFGFAGSRPSSELLGSTRENLDSHLNSCGDENNAIALFGKVKIENQPDTNCAFIPAEQDVLHVWQSWNRAQEKLQRNGTIIPTSNRTHNALFQKIAGWLSWSGPDWELSWNRVVKEVAGNNFFTHGYRDFVPNLDWMFSKKEDVYNIDCVLNGKYDHMRKQVTGGLNEDGSPTEDEIKRMIQGMAGMEMMGIVD